eukprot:evm.model.scf_1616.3 EVM.evm.TU.scf_1616.3   scf_1616:12182-15852(+)
MAGSNRRGAGPMFRACLLLHCLAAVRGEGEREGNLGLAPHGEGGLKPRHGRRLLEPSLDEVLLVGKLDGTVTALELETGRVLWSFDSGSPLVSSGKSHGDGRPPVSHVFPGADGALYRVQSGGASAKLENFGITVPELVENSPSLTDNGSLILGSQTSTLFYIDMQTGELLRTLSSKDVIDADISSDKEISKAPILPMGRRDYVVQSVDYATGVVQWNVSFSVMHQLEMAIVKDSEAVVGFLSGNPAPESAKSATDGVNLEWGADYSLHAKDPTSGLDKWDISFPTPPVVAYTLQGGGRDVLPLWSPDYGLSPAALTSSPGVWTSKDEHVFIGAIAGGGLYALPAPSGASKEALGIRNPNIAATAVVHLEDTSQWKMVQVEPGITTELEGLICVVGVQTVERPEAPPDWLPPPNKSTPEVVSGKEHVQCLC